MTAILLAGSRPGTDPLAAHFNVPAKALVPLAGEPMVSRVARAQLEHPRVGTLLILAQADHLLTAEPAAAWIATHPRVRFEHGGSSVSEALLTVLERYPDDYPFLVTTADHGLLDGPMIDAFVDGAVAAATDLSVGLVERRVLEASYPGNRRTWLRFRGGSYSGANLFWFSSARVLAALQLWRGIEQDRKRGRAVIAAFGPAMLAGVALRLLTLDGALARAGRRLGLTATAVRMPMAEACIDIDKIGDHRLASSILADRSRAVAGTGGAR